MGYKCHVTKKHHQGKPVKVVTKYNEHFRHLPVVKLKDGTEKVLFYEDDLDTLLENGRVAIDDDHEPIFVDKGGYGRQIVKEVLMCPDAAEKWLARQAEVDAVKQAEILRARKAEKLRKLNSDNAAADMKDKVNATLALAFGRRRR